MRQLPRSAPQGRRRVSPRRRCGGFQDRRCGRPSEVRTRHGGAGRARPRDRLVPKPRLQDVARDRGQPGGPADRLMRERERFVAFVLSALGAAAIAASSLLAAPPRATAQPEPSASPSPVASASPGNEPAAPESASPAASEEPSGSPSPTEIVIPPSPQPVQLGQSSIGLILGRGASIRVSSPPSGVLILSGFDPAVVRAIFNPISRTIDLWGLHAGTTTITATDSFGLTATVAVTVQAYAGKAYDSTSVTITGDPARLVAYPESGARVDTDLTAVRGSVALAADNAARVTVPISISGAGYATYQKNISVLVQNVAQPGIPPKNLLVSDFPETIVENGTLFYSDVSIDEPARLLYYHYANPSSQARRVIVKAQNNGIDSSVLAMLSGIAGPSPNILSVGHESTKRFLVYEASNQGRVFEVPPHATVNIVDQLLPAATLVSGLMQLRVISGSSIRVAVVVQDATEVPVGPISDTLLSSAVKHARGVYSVPDFSYDLSYSIGNDPAVLLIGKLPLPNLVSGEVLGGDYGVKQSATVTLLNSTSSEAHV